MKPFVDYYRENNISPVAQDISDLPRHFDRRRSLYRALGIVPAFVQDRSVIEFGPGSGYNAMYTGSLNPKRFVLVDGNPVGFDETKRLLDVQFGKTLKYDLVASLIEDFETDERFDVVLCEGTIPFQLEPEAFTRRIASFCKPGGVLVVTCASAASCLGEIARRFMASRLIDRTASMADQLDGLRPFIAPHLATMVNMSRSVDDWVKDNIIHPLVGKTFSIPSAIAAVDAEFEIYGESPQFIGDWRWYKDVWGDAKRFNSRAETAYLQNVVNFLDCRVELPPHSTDLGERVSALAESIYVLMQEYERNHDDGARVRAAGLLLNLAGLVESLSPRTAASLREAGEFIASPDPRALPLAEFASYFGRGQQYLSFIRRV